MSFYKQINTRYGNKKTSLLKEYAKTVNKTAHIKTTKACLLKCRKHSIIPSFITNSTKKVTQLLDSTSKHIAKLNNITVIYHKKILNLLIDAKCHVSRYTENMLYNLQEEIINTLPQHISDPFLKKQKQYYDQKTTELTHTHTHKFNTIYEKQVQALKLFSNNNKNFLNLTNVYVSDDIKWILGLGKKFAIKKYGDFPLFEIIADTEEIVKTIRNITCRDIVRARIANVIANKQKQYAQKNFTNITQNTISNIYKKCIVFCKQNKNVIVVQSDKTNCTVLMYASDYNEKVKELLSDINTYKILTQGDPTMKLQTLNNNFIMELFKNNIFDSNLKNSLTNYNTTSPKLYALPKTHKENIPMRPVVASINTPSSRLSKYLSGILKNLLTDDEYNISNSYNFKNRISGVALDSGEKMVSFDVVSLFTNIPVDLAIDIVTDRWDELNAYTNIPREMFFKLLKFCLIDANYFVYNNVFYKQIFGMPMGNPLSSVIADIITQRLLNTTLNSLSEKPKLLVKYVDDIFAIVQENMINSTLNALNNFHTKLKFTVEHETDNSLAFLDMLLIRGLDGVLTTDWYQKKDSSNRVLNYFSNHPTNQKYNTAYNLAHRVLTLSSVCYHKNNIKRIFDILEINNYPSSIIKRAINSCLQKTMHSTQTTDNNNYIRQTKDKIYKSLTYIEGLSEKITKITKTYTSNVQIAHKSNVCLNNVFTKLKDKVPVNKKTDVIYQIPCLGTGDPNEKCRLTYVGQTKQFLEKRIKNHIYDIKKPQIQSVPKTAVVQHFQDLGHYPDFENTKILDTQKHYGKRLTIEALHIYTQNTYNQRRDVEDIAPVFCAIVDDVNQRKKRRYEQTHKYNNHHHTDENPNKRQRLH